MDIQYRPQAGAQLETFEIAIEGRPDHPRSEETVIDAIRDRKLLRWWIKKWLKVEFSPGASFILPSGTKVEVIEGSHDGIDVKVSAPTSDEGKPPKKGYPYSGMRLVE